LSNPIASEGTEYWKKGMTTKRTGVSLNGDSSFDTGGSAHHNLIPNPGHEIGLHAY